MVADEVRSLANKTTSSTQNIQEKVDQIQTSANIAAKKMLTNSETAKQTHVFANQAGESLNAITEAVKNITDMSMQIASAAEEQSIVADDVSKNIVSISDLANETDKSSKTLGNSSAGLSQLAVNLNNWVSRFKV